jgi:hypothetical protein
VDLLAQVAVASPDLALRDWNLQGLPAIVFWIGDNLKRRK